MKLKSEESSIDTNSPAGAMFKDSFVSDGNFSIGYLGCMVETWINIEDEL